MGPPAGRPPMAEPGTMGPPLRGAATRPVEPACTTRLATPSGTFLTATRPGGTRTGWPVPRSMREVVSLPSPWVTRSAATKGDPSTERTRTAKGPWTSRAGMASSAVPPLAIGSPKSPGGRKVALAVVTRTSTLSWVGLGLVTSTWAWAPPPLTPPANDQAGWAAPWAGRSVGALPPLLTAAPATTRPARATTSIDGLRPAGASSPRARTTASPGWMNTSRSSGRIEPEVRWGTRSTTAGWLSGLAMITLVSVPKRVSAAGSHQRFSGPGAQPSPGALTTTGALNASTCTNPGFTGSSDSFWVAPPASFLVTGADLVPVSRTVVRSEAAASPTLAMVTGVAWPGSSGQTQRAE